MGKAGEPRTVQVDDQRVMGCNKNVNSQIKFFVPNQKGILDVPLNDVGFRLVWIIRPFVDVADFLEQKYPLSLTFSDGLHNPEGLVIGPFELLKKDGIFVG